MEQKILQEFIGEINGVEIKNESIYYATEFVLNPIEKKFGECYNKNFVRDLSGTIEDMWLKYNEFSFDVLERDFTYAVEFADSFESIDFEYEGQDWKIDWLNEEIADGNYTKEEVKETEKETENKVDLKSDKKNNNFSR